MKRLAFPCLVFGLLVVFCAPLRAAAGTETAVVADKSPAAPVAHAISTVTGIAISPLLGTGAYGAWQWWRAKTPGQKQALPWYARVSFWLPALLLVGACAAKDSLGAVLPPGFKKPLDVLELLENKAAGLVAAGAVVPFVMSALSGAVADSPAAHPALHAAGLAAIDWSWLLTILTVPLGLAVFALVWMASHAINVLILLSPWGAIDAALKGARTALLGLITVTATLDPWLSALLSLAVVVVAYFVAGWSFRLTVFGSVFSWDFFTLGKKRFTPAAEGGNKLFSGARLTRIGVPVRTYGRLAREAGAGRLDFTYRPWLIGAARTLVVPLEAGSVGRGLFFSTIRDGDRTAFLLPPRYRGHEEEVARIYGLAGGVQDAGLLRAWGSLKELFGGSAAKAQVG